MKGVLACALLPGLAACASYKKAIPEVSGTRPPANPVKLEFSERARIARFTRFVSGIPAGYHYGEFATASCLRRKPMTNTNGSFEIDVKAYVDLFNTVMKEHGYPVDSELELFPDSKERVADVHVGAKLVELSVNECFPRAGNFARAFGSAYVKLEWSVYSAIERKVILVIATEGSTYGEIESAIGEPGILRPALEDAVRRLAESPGYHAIIDPPTLR